MSTARTRVLIVDDEPLARERIRTLLADEPGFKLVGEAGDGPSGAESIIALQPDLVFLDVQMPGADRFVVKSGGRIFFVRTGEIDWIEAAGNYVKLHVGNDSHLIRETMNAVEAKLSPDMFVRIHRCHIVNIEQVRELQPWFNGEYVVFLKNGTRLTLSRGYRERLQERVGRTI